MSDNRQKLQMSRRTLLKIIAAAGGSMAASAMLPGKWVKPVMRAGVLPVHAQTSSPVAAPYRIVDSTAEQEPQDGCFLNLSVTISPADDGIEMQVVILDPADERTETITATTIAGVATFTSQMCTGASTTTVTFSFVNPVLCSTTCSVQHTFH